MTYSWGSGTFLLTYGTENGNQQYWENDKIRDFDI